MYKTEIYFYLQVTLMHTRNIRAKFASNQSLVSEKMKIFKKNCSRKAL
jgi:hypothetical protein